MLTIVNEYKLSQTDLKCISPFPLAVGGGAQEIYNLSTDRTVSTAAKINSMVPFQDGILCGLSNGNLLYSNTNEEYTVLCNGNICTISVKHDQILLGDWNNQATLLVKEEARGGKEVCINGTVYAIFTLQHPACIWAVEIIDENTFVTGCADGFVRLYKNKKLEKEICQHSHAVRGLVVVKDYVISVDNYGKILKTKLNGNIIKSRDLNEMAFSIATFNELLLVSGENGSVFVITDSLEVICRTDLPCTSCWCVRTDGQSILACGSDGVLYSLIYKEDSSAEEISEMLCAEQKWLHKNSGKKEDDEKLKQKNKFEQQKDGIFTSGGTRFKIQQGKIYQEIESEWRFIGDVDKTYDNSFTVELQGRNYTLSFDDNENTHEVATRFLSENKMSFAYHQEIVDFIKKNFKKKTAFKFYETIDISGLTAFLNKQPNTECQLALEVLKEIEKGTYFSLYQCADKNVYQIEKLMMDIPLVARLDICKYLIYKKIRVDLSFIKHVAINNKKEAKAFVYLATNMAADPPFSLADVKLQIRQLRDCSLLGLEDVKWFEHNVELIKRNG